MTRPFPLRSTRRRRGLTVAESIVCMTIVGVMLVAALNAVGAARMTQTRGLQRQQAHLIAASLLDEIASQAYEDAEDLVNGPGPSSAELANGKRVLFNDINDYAGWTASPPQRRDGTAIPDTTGWRETVTIAYLDPNDLAGNGFSDNRGITRVSVSVSVNGATQAEISAVFSRGPPETVACCLPDGSCREMTEADCIASGGQSGGANSSCINTSCNFGLVARWTMDEAAGNTIVDSVNSLSGAITGASFDSGRINAGISLDGTDDYITVPHSSVLSITNEITVCAWVYKDSNSGWDDIIVKGGTTSRCNYGLRMHNSDMVFSVYDGLSLYDVFSNVKLSTDRWFHIAVTFNDTTDMMRFYVDGSLRVSGIVQGNLRTNSDPLYIGCSPIQASNFDGMIDDIRIYNRALTTAEVRAIYQDAPQ